MTAADRVSRFEVREIVDRKLVEMLRFLAESAKERPLTVEDYEHAARVIERRI